MIDQEKITKAAIMLSEGKTPSQVFRATLIPLDVIEQNGKQWVTDLKQGNFMTIANRAFTPSQRLNEVMPRAVKLLEGKDIDGFFGTVAPVVAMQLAKDAVTSPDERIRHSAQKDLLDRAGYKPKTQVELYTKYDRMQKDELIAAIRGAMMSNPAFMERVLSIQEKISDGGAIQKDDDEGGMMPVLVERVMEPELTPEQLKEWEDL